MNTCPNLDEDSYPRLCFCPTDDMTFREVLSRGFINGWVNEQWYRAARTLVSSSDYTEAKGRLLLTKIEEDANRAYAMWTETQ